MSTFSSMHLSNAQKMPSRFGSPPIGSNSESLAGEEPAIEVGPARYSMIRQISLPEMNEAGMEVARSVLGGKLALIQASRSCVPFCDGCAIVTAGCVG